MKKFTAVIAAIVIVGAGFVATPAYAAESPDPRPEVATVAPPVEVTPPHAREIQAHTPAQADAGVQAAPDAASDASIYGQVSDADGFVSGVIVTAFQFDAKGKLTFQSASVTTDGTGAYTIEGLAAGNYWLEFEEHRNPDMPSWQWWGSDTFNPYGNWFTVPAHAGVRTDFTLADLAGVKGSVTCETCAGAPDPSLVTIYVGAYNGSTDTYDFIDSEHPGADGSFGFDSLFPFDDYRIFARYTGTGPFNEYSNSEQFAMTADTFAATSVNITRHVDPVSGIRPSVNSNVNAFYWDYLTRLPSSSDVSFWGAQIQRGANLSIIAAGFVSSDEYRYIRIDNAYRTILGREPDAAGRLNWLTGMRGGVLTTDDIETTFYASDEYYLQHGNSNRGFTEAIYRTLLGRDGTSSDYDFWSNLVVKNGRSWVIHQFWDSQETISARVSGMYKLYLGRTPDAAGLANWVGIALQIGDSGLRAGLSGSDEYFVRSQFRFREE
ncbi:hypothetical protein B7R54_15270 [Subtercola boreus]|uniref:alpha-amylase n=1 Tax=Subtercola boreus TaxID=120213 RepID=A0A3E0VKB9_9MICO|nr:DUF4214 domain-containing protein [Subtercola boreus]RFA10412.1 hypothetical protein B7R54_15270 [Subtercola boreus]TQL56066.1 uncharacterized protein DUF4214 [Subtercola boreus]